MAGMELAVGVELTHGADPPIADRARGKSDGGAGGEPCMLPAAGTITASKASPTPVPPPRGASPTTSRRRATAAPTGSPPPAMPPPQGAPRRPCRHCPEGLVNACAAALTGSSTSAWP
ncbi:hypothetical protein BDA96_04G170700 [Sorghum bicolor]|uniref:Uncharacterized protein n=1 Tax=Sorghum bicolor TaxID=4558 RepID=A0A921R3B6_SORBI|nr:hypothetical protein BDA96_04G170700 [Sorghum bicolor]